MTVQGEVASVRMPSGQWRERALVFIFGKILPPEASRTFNPRHTRHHSALAISSFMISLVPP